MLALGVGIVVFVSVYFWLNTRTLVPLDIPVALARGHLNVCELGGSLQSAGKQFPLLARPTG
jgi:hypothetical protein